MRELFSLLPRFHSFVIKWRNISRQLNSEKNFIFKKKSFLNEVDKNIQKNIKKNNNNSKI